MINLKSLDDVKQLQSNMRASLDTDQGKEVILFLEQICGWYDFNEVDPNRILIAHGKRQVLATVKTILESTPEQVVMLAKLKE